MDKIIIIGGGASGLTAAINAKRKDNEVIILEKNKECGKKILVTGNGRCNYMNEDFTINHYNSSNIEILSTIINDNNKEMIKDFFNTLGIIPKIKNNYYYPSSNQSLTIQKSLIEEAINKGIKIITESNVINIKKENNIFTIYTENDTYTCNKLILSLGSKASPITGATETGYNLAKYFHHTIIKPLPSLVGLKIEGRYLREWNGVRTDVKLKLIENDKIVKEETGEIQLTDYGVSGICIFQLSSKIGRGLLEGKKEQIEIDFLPFIEIKNYEEFVEYFDNRNNKLSKRRVLDLFQGIINNKLAKILLQESEININTYWNNLSSVEKRNIYHKFKKNIITPISTGSFEKAQVCSGGVPLKEININTMESNICNNLYIIGELLDVDGDCGGYNLSFAWLSGLLAGKNIKKGN